MTLSKHRVIPYKVPAARSWLIAIKKYGQLKPKIIIPYTIKFEKYHYWSISSEGGIE